MNTNVSEKTDKAVPVTKTRIVVKEVGDQTYIQVNKVSFQQNFKALIGHYKKTGSYNPVMNLNS